MIALIMSGTLVVYSVVKTLYIANSKKNNKLIGYDVSVLNDKDAKEFSNYITNLLSNLTFFYGTLLYVLDVYTDYGIYIGIAFVALTAIQDYYFIKKLFPREYKRLRG